MLNPQFGSGVLSGIPNGGNLPANPTPMQFGILQEVQVEFKADLKKLFGTSQLPLAKARGKVNVTAKGKIGSLDPLFFSQLYFGLPTTARRESADLQRSAWANRAHTSLFRH
jgi:hypothetical protein